MGQIRPTRFSGRCTCRLSRRGLVRASMGAALYLTALAGCAPAASGEAASPPSPTPAPCVPPPTPTPAPSAAPIATAKPTASRTAAASATPTPAPLAAGYLRAQGSKLVDAKGNEAILTGINWFGFETDACVPHGLWSRNWGEMLDLVAKLGYNVIRLPYGNHILDPDSKVGSLNADANPDLQGLSPLQVMDKIVEGAGKRGLKIILDRHRPTPAAQSALWYVDAVPEEQWIADWVFLARRYRENDTVIGADLHNEPHGEATWGSGDPKTDWRLAAERCGNAVLGANPDLLIVVEGVEKRDDDWYWWGGNLESAADAPVRLTRPEKLVYSAHDYSPNVYNQKWFQDPSFPDNLPDLWDGHWSYLAKKGVAPVLLGEFGGRSVGDDREGVWQRALVAYVKASRISYTYWCLNPNSGDTGGVLQDDWQTVNQEKQSLLASYQAPKLPVANASAIDLSVVPPARKSGG